MKTTKLLALFAAVVPTVAAAELPKEVAGMDCLVGTWKATGSVTMGKDKAKIDATWTCKRTSAKFGVACSLVLTGVPGLPKYEETDLFGYEPNSKTYHWFSVTNAGETHDHVAPFTEGNKIQFVYTGTQEGKPLKEVIDFEIPNEKTLNMRSETFVAGVSTSVMEAKAKK